jgi:hypothetical protein
MVAGLRGVRYSRDTAQYTRKCPIHDAWIDGRSLAGYDLSWEARP